MLDAIGIVCENIDRSKEFYKHLGLEFESIGSEDHWEAQTPNGLRIMLDSVKLIKQINPQWIKTKNHSLVLCFKQDSPAKLDRIYDLLTQNDFHSVKEPWDAFWGQRYASILDPDENQIDLFAEL